MTLRSTAQRGQMLPRLTEVEDKTEQFRDLVDAGLRTIAAGAPGTRSPRPVDVGPSAPNPESTATPQVALNYGDVLPFPPSPTIPRRTFRLLAKWEGIVDDVLVDSFTAELHDIHGDDTPKVAEFALEEVDPADRNLVRPGAVFYWSVGYNVYISGQQERASSMYFRRLPVRTQVVRPAHDESVDTLAQRIGWKLSPSK